MRQRFSLAGAAFCVLLVLTLNAAVAAEADEPADPETPWPYEVREATGNYAAGGRGAATGPGGRTVIGAGGTAGDAYAGTNVSGGRAVVYNRNTGAATTIGGIKGNKGGVIHVGGNVYAGHDGNVWHRTDDGWQSMTGGNGGTQYARPNVTESRRLDQDRFSRDMGGQRYNLNRGSSGMMHRSFGGRRR